MQRAPHLVAVLVVSALTAATGCSRQPPESTPEGAVREFVERMRRVSGDPAEEKAAFGLLSKRAQENLAARAQRYSAATGKTIAPEAMIVPSRFTMRFELDNLAAQIIGPHALVRATGSEPGQSADVPCVYEDGGWRVDATLPPLPPLQKRPGTP
jgi:hypothetical protein